MNAGEVLCPVCGGGPFPNSHDGWMTHDSGPRHRLFLMGIMPDDAAQIEQAIYATGVSFDVAMAALRAAMALPPDRLREAADQLRQFAGLPV